MSTKPFIDKILGLTISKKLFVWAIGTIMVIFLNIEISDNWLILTGIYLGIQGIVDILKEKVRAQGQNGGMGNFFNSSPFNNGTDNFEK